MSCFLCNSVYHFSHNCDTYESDESRHEALIAKNWCPNCLNSVSEIHAKKWDRCCSKNTKKCYLCFSREHHTIFCPERYTVPNMIVPTIDKDLHKRFFRLFDGILEQYMLAFLSQEMFERINTGQNRLSKFQSHSLRVTYRELHFYDSLRNESDAEKFNNLVYQFPNRSQIFYITNDVILNNVKSYFFTYQFMLLCGSDNIKYIPKKVVLQDCKIWVDSFFRLFSNYTKILECKDLVLINSVKFEEVIKRVPNIVELVLEKTNIIADEFWADNLLKFKNSNNFSKLELEINGFKFNIKNLVAFIKNKCVKNVHMKLNIISDDEKEKRGHKKELLDKLSEYFESKNPALLFLSFNILKTDKSDGEKNDRMFASFTKLTEK